MLFSSYIFVFAFLPAALAGYFVAARYGRPVAAAWLVLASLVFYAYWRPAFLPVLLISIAFNWSAGVAIARFESRPITQTWLLGGAIAANLAALCYFKYLFVWLGFLRDAGIIGFGLSAIALPLGISFFTFTQIGYLVDVKQGVAKDRGLLNYVLFVTFFPHLIAGPILHHREMMPQFADPATYRFSAENLSVGLSLFIIGLMKKTLLADPTSVVVAPGFAAAGGLGAWAAWHAALAYSLQLYFDFSGYSDMAIGLARMFNVRFPLNFNSPYKAASVIDYWQRWHMTLTRYLTLYLYNPIALAVARRRAARGLGTNKAAHATVAGFAELVAYPTFVTMALAGVWHGAGWQFLVFGLLHAFYLMVNNAWRAFRPKSTQPDGAAVHLGKVALTYLCVLVGAIFFRAASCGDAAALIGDMLGGNGGGAPPAAADLGWLAALFGIVWCLPNSQQIMASYQPALGKVAPPAFSWLRWRPDPRWGIALGVGAMLAILGIGGTTEFLYFQF